MSDPKGRYTAVTNRWSALVRARNAMEEFLKNEDHENANKALGEMVRVIDASNNDIETLIDEIHELQRRIDHVRLS